MKSNLSAYFLGFFGIALVGIGIFFIFFRPYLLPEDIRFMNLNETLEHSFRDLVSPWLKLVFCVLGGYIISSGILFLFLAKKSFREFEPGAWLTAFFAGIFSIGVMTVINFKIESDFRWWILLLNIVWISSIILNLFENKEIITSLAKTKQNQKEIL